MNDGMDEDTYMGTEFKKNYSAVDMILLDLMPLAQLVEHFDISVSTLGTLTT